MKIIFNFIHSLIWRLGRKLYTYSRGDTKNNPFTNGEYWLLNKLLNGFSGQKILFDVGANIGNWTDKVLSFSKNDKNLYIYAIEPSRYTRLMLTNRFKQNKFVSIQPYAFSSSIGKANFYSKEDGGGTNSLSSISGKKTEIVEVTTIDQFIKDNKIKNISMIKIDAEGYDYLILKGAKKALSEGKIEVVQFEYSWRWLVNHVCLKDIFELILDTPYRFGKLVGKSIEFYDVWHFELDKFFENNYVLIRRDSFLCEFGKKMYFDESNVAIKD
jgi:FkbM family methyltransferase